MKNEEKPLVSVLMAVYNGAPYLEEAVQSILNQTYRNIELLVVNDCSQDDSLVILERMQRSDKRVHIINNVQNSGLAASLKVAMAHASGEYLARMDADDIAVPDRFELQVRFLEQNSLVDIVGSWKKCFGASDYLSKYPETIDACKATLLFNVPVGHPCVMMRHNAFKARNLTYDPALREGEDYDIWFRAWEQGLNFSNIPKVLLRYRAFPKKAKQGVKAQRVGQSVITREKALTFFGVPYTSEEAKVHHQAAALSFEDRTVSIEAVEAWFLKLAQFNAANNLLDDTAFNSVLADKFFHVCYHHPDKQGRKKFLKSRFSKYYSPSVLDSAKWILRSVVR